jgi:hypothetical protein
MRKLLHRILTILGAFLLILWAERGAAHKRLDAAMFDAYGWPHDLSDEKTLGSSIRCRRSDTENPVYA